MWGAERVAGMTRRGRTHDEKPESRDIPSAASLTVAAREKQKPMLKTRRNSAPAMRSGQYD